MGKGNAILTKSNEFALEIVKLSKWLVSDKNEFVLSRQVLRSGTSIGANVRESKRAQSTADFCLKLNISLKEVDETSYWLELLYESGYINKETFDELYADCQEFIRLLVAILKTLRSNEI